MSTAEQKYQAYNQLLTTLEEEGRRRHIPESLRPGSLDFCSNDYMGLNNNPSGDDLAENAAGSAASSRLLCTDQQEFTALESFLEELYGKPALLFNSGYHANTGTVSALASVPNTVILSDKLIHASIIDGIRLSKAPFQRFRHNDMAHLERLLEENKEADRVIVITESIFSMDGDEAPISELIELKKRFTNMLLYVDEAHAFGCRGDRGLGLCEEIGCLEDIDILVGTFGKAAASMGAFVVTSQLLKDVLVNTARSFIFSTALPPSVIAHAHRNIRLLTNMQQERRHLADLSATFRRELMDMGFAMPSVSQIVPWIIGDAKRAVEIADKLKDRGFNVLPIRKPTVPAGTERLRFSITAAMNRRQIDALLQAIKEITVEYED